jgi:hypothetical protein
LRANALFPTRANGGFILSVDGSRYETTQGKAVAQIFCIHTVHG